VIETRREPALVHALGITRELTKAELLDIERSERIAGILGTIDIEYNYKSSRSRLTDESTITLIRATATQLDQELKNAGTVTSAIEVWPPRHRTPYPGSSICAPGVKHRFVFYQELSQIDRCFYVVLCSL
jgi:hypothetical protein